jgi:hypothetical protein
LFDCLYAGVGEPRPPLVNCPCGGGDDCQHVRTLRFRRNPNSVPWQNDYIFASRNLASRLRDCRTLDTEDIWAESDHCILLATFEFDAPASHTLSI